MSNPHGYQLWLRNGRLTALIWLLILLIDVAFHVFHIDDQGITNALVAMTGLLVGNLGIAQGNRITRTEEDVEKLKTTAISHHPDADEDLR